jgi:hypothetical protein
MADLITEFRRLRAKAERMQAEADRQAIRSRSVTRAAKGINTNAELAAFHADVLADLLTGALTPKEVRGLTRGVTRAVDERLRGR